MEIYKSNNLVTVIKLNYAGSEMMRYSGQLVFNCDSLFVVKAHFTLDKHELNNEITLFRNDTFLEAYFPRRWYNIFAIFHQSTSQLKCWYCNIAEPAQICGDFIYYKDLSLDLLVYPDGKQLILDLQEFDTLPISQKYRKVSLNALQYLRNNFSSHGYNDIDIVDFLKTFQ